MLFLTLLLPCLPLDFVAGPEDWLQVLYDAYLMERSEGNHRNSITFYIQTARWLYTFLRDQDLYEEATISDFCTRIITNSIELKIQDAQMFRSVAYFLMMAHSMDEAILLFEQVEELAPAEPHSYLDLALALFFRIRLTEYDDDACERLQQERDIARSRRGDEEMRGVDWRCEDLDRSVRLISKVMRDDSWVGRFNEIEYMAIIWLNWVVNYAKAKELQPLKNSPAYEADAESFWPSKLVPADKFAVPDFALALLYCCGWDTDHVDIDLHIHEPRGEHVYYGHRDSMQTNARMSRDFTDGYGPEVYALPCPVEGSFECSVNYYGSHQDSPTTGSTSVVVWRVTNMGDYEFEDIDFTLARLTSHGGSQKIGTVVSPGCNF